MESRQTVIKMKFCFGTVKEVSFVIRVADFILRIRETRTLFHVYQGHLRNR